MTVVEVSLDLLHHSRFELHRAKSINPAINVVIFLAGAGVEVQADAAHLGAGLQWLLRALDLEGFGDGDRIAVGKRIAYGVDDGRLGSFRGRVAGSSVGGELVRALGADDERRHLVGVLGGAFGAGRQSCGRSIRHKKQSILRSAKR